MERESDTRRIDERGENRPNRTIRREGMRAGRSGTAPPRATGERRVPRRPSGVPGRINGRP
ncbi:hypothetical protein, partial [Burkholderia territorii]|uniref:hypothetical protein n=1 Tax=Burkholderia territorii TaxID=1503055 RepID=UPI001BABE704